MKVLFMGRKPVGANCLSYLISLDNVEVVGVLTDTHLSCSPTGDLAKSHGIPCYTHEECMAAIKSGEMEFDLGVSMLYWRKVGGEMLTMPSLGVVNFHPAPLPEYKGTAGYNMAILDALPSWGATAHYMDEEIDTGGIIEVRDVPFDESSDTAMTVERNTRPVLQALFQDTVDLILNDKAKLPTQPNVGGRYISRQQMEDMKEIKPGDDISRKIRAFWFPPYDGAYVIVDGQKYTLLDRNMLQALAPEGESSLFTPET